MKINIGLVFGGCSVEHEISVISALQAYHNYHGERYELIPIYLSKNKEFYYGKDLVDVKNYTNLPKLLKKCSQIQFKKKNNKTFIQAGFKKVEIDAVWLVTHGNNCEDGTLYNYFNMLNIVCLGLDSFQGSISQDKSICKQLMQANKIKQTKFFWVHTLQYNQNSDDVINQANKIGYPLIVKPAKLGSSVGIQICYNDANLIDAIEEAFIYDTKVLVEEFIENAREFNISLLGDIEEYRVSAIEEVTKNSFLSYDDKYNSHSKCKGMAGLNRIVPANIDVKLGQNIIQTAKKVASILDTALCVRLDFLYDTEKKVLYFNEINNIPGSLAFYLWEKVDLSFNALIESILDIGIKNEYMKAHLTLSYHANIFNTAEIEKISICK